MTKVFLVNKAGHKYEGATEFGELVPVTQGNVDIFNVDRCHLAIVERLKEYKPGDYLLLCGSALLSCLAVSYLLGKYGKVNVLIFHAKLNGRYIPRTIHAWTEEREVNHDAEGTSAAAAEGAPAERGVEL